MKEDPCNLARWKHKQWWHNRGCVWDTLATDWSSKEDWISKGKKFYALEDKTTFVTFALDSVKLSTVHKKRVKGKKVDDEAPRVLGPADTIIHTREEGPTVQPCGDSEVAGKWINGQHSPGLKCRGNIGQIQNTLYS